MRPWSYDAAGDDGTGVLHLVHVHEHASGDPHAPARVLWRCKGLQTTTSLSMVHKTTPYNCMLCIEAGE